MRPSSSFEFNRLAYVLRLVPNIFVATVGSSLLPNVDLSLLGSKVVRFMVVYVGLLGRDLIGGKFRVGIVLIGDALSSSLEASIAFSDGLIWACDSTSAVASLDFVSSLIVTEISPRSTGDCESVGTASCCSSGDYCSCRFSPLSVVSIIYRPIALLL